MNLSPKQINIAHIIFLIVSIVWSNQSQGASNRRFQNPILSRSNHSVENVVLGRSCLSLRSTQKSISCNPAALANEDRKQFRANLVFDNNLSDVLRTIRNLSDDDSFSVLKEVESHYKPVSGQGHLNLWYQDDWWAIGITPIRGVLVTKTTNPAYPEVETIAAKESELFLRSGFFLESDPRFSLGFDVRFVTREFIDHKVDLTEATSDLSQISAKSGNQIYIEPGFIYSFDSSWKAELSAAITNWSAISNGTKINEDPIIDIGLSSTPNFLDGKYRSTLHLSTSPATRSVNIIQRIRWSGLFSFSEQLSASLTLSNYEQAIGILGHVDSLVLGMGLKNEKSFLASSNQDQIKSLIFDIGLVF